jgi:hypothetical protein
VGRLRGSNFTSYTKGINGMIVELTGVPPAELVADDFVFRAGTGAPPSAGAAGSLAGAVAARSPRRRRAVPPHPVPAPPASAARR